MFLRTEPSRFARVAAVGMIICALALPVDLTAADQPTVEGLKARVERAGIADRPPLCIQIAERQLGSAERFYAIGDSAAAKGALADIVTFSEAARDYAIQSRKHEKPSEIAMRKMARKLADLKHTLPHEDQEDVQNAVNRVERIRDDLLLAMFPKVGKK
jgi:hypothetical protein